MESDNDTDGEPGLLGAGPDSAGWRQSVRVGPRRRLQSMGGLCVGDDVSWRGSNVLRIVSLQSAGSGGDLHFWGRWWGSALQDAGADIGVLSETRIASDQQHISATNGLLDAGFIAISHNVTSITSTPRQQGESRPSPCQQASFWQCDATLLEI